MDFKEVIIKRLNYSIWLKSIQKYTEYKETVYRLKQVITVSKL